MRLFEAIVDANHRAAAGSRTVSLALDNFADALPVVALTCIDTRLNDLLPRVLGLPDEHFVWLRNAGNIITGPLSSTMRSMALACAIKGGKEVAVIGHTDCKAGQTTLMKLTEAFRALGIDRARLPENLTQFFGLFASERQNIVQSVALIRVSPLIGPRVPVHGLLLDVTTGRLEWVVNGYESLGSLVAKLGAALPEKAAAVVGGLAQLAGFDLSGLSLPTAPIGEIGSIGSSPSTSPVGSASSASLPGRSAEPAPPVLPDAEPPPLPATKPPPVLPKPRFVPPWKRRG